MSNTRYSPVSPTPSRSPDSVLHRRRPLTLEALDTTYAIPSTDPAPPALNHTVILDSSAPANMKRKSPRTWLASSTHLRPCPDSNLVKWGIHWYTPVGMILIFFLGVGSAITHHLYYTMLHDTPAGTAYRQRWVIQIGTGLAFLSRASLVSVVEVARTQWLWLTLRKRFITLGGIDAMFGVTSDPTYFLNLAMLRGAKLTTLMAALIWIFSLTAILTPGSISVRSVPETTLLPCTVRTLRFPFDTHSTAQPLWWEGKNITNVGVARWNEAELAFPAIVARVMKISAYTDLIQLPQNMGQRIGDTNTTLLGQRLNDTTIGVDCAGNCTYTISFLGPAINCTDRSAANWARINSTATRWLDGAPYRAVKLAGSYELRIGWLPGKTESQPNPNPRVVECRNIVARYTVMQEIQNYRFREPVIESVKTVQASIPDELMVAPNTMYLANGALYLELRNIFIGNISESELYSTTLMTSPRDIPYNLDERMEIMAQKMIVSLLSIDYSGTDPSRPLLHVAALQNVQCGTIGVVSLYNYTAWTLITVYAVSVAIALIMGVIGFVALGRNGMASATSFSSILQTTRNPTLDRYMEGTCLGAGPIPRGLGMLKLRFGEVVAQGSGRTIGEEMVGHLALGVEGEVFDIDKGAKYS